MKKNEIPPTRAREGLGLPSPHSLVLEVYTRYPGVPVSLCPIGPMSQCQKEKRKNIEKGQTVGRIEKKEEKSGGYLTPREGQNLPKKEEYNPHCLARVHRLIAEICVLYAVLKTLIQN